MHIVQREFDPAFMVGGLILIFLDVSHPSFRSNAVLLLIGIALCAK